MFVSDSTVEVVLSLVVIGACFSPPLVLLLHWRSEGRPPEAEPERGGPPSC